MGMTLTKVEEHQGQMAVTPKTTMANGQYIAENAGKKTALQQ